MRARCLAPTMAGGLALVVLCGCATLKAGGRGEDLPHFFQVAPSVYRGGQPTAEGFRQLARMGVRTVVDLRAEHIGRSEKNRVESLGMQWVHLPILPGGRPSHKQAAVFLELVRNPEDAPVFVHCQRGRHRTGILVAIYRVVVQGWSPERSYAEARSLGLSRSPILREVILNETGASVQGKME